MVWESERLDLDAYLARIGYGGPLDRSVETLTALHAHHVAAIPFENLEIVLGRGIPLDLDSVQAKLVARRRGGYCFEHNRLFAAVLERLGFPITPMAARVTVGGVQPHPKSHMCLRVEAGEYALLADVGFGGDGLLEPVVFAPDGGGRQDVPGWPLVLDRASAADTGEPWALRRDRDTDKQELYRFALERRWPIDYQVLSWYTSTHPGSHFVRRVIAQRIDRDVRRSLVDDTLVREYPDGRREERPVPRDELPEALSAEIGIELTAADAAALRGWRPPERA